MKIMDTEIIIQAEKALAKAHLELDITTIDALLHEDYIIAQPDGKIEIKEDVLKSLEINP